MYPYLGRREEYKQEFQIDSLILLFGPLDNKIENKRKNT